MPGDISGKRQDLVFSLYQERDRYIAVALSYVQDMEKARDIVSDSFA